VRWAALLVVAACGGGGNVCPRQSPAAPPPPPQERHDDCHFPKPPAMQPRYRDLRVWCDADKEACAPLSAQDEAALRWRVGDLELYVAKVRFAAAEIGCDLEGAD